MIIPPYLSNGSTIGITCPAGFVSMERVSYCVKMLQDWNFRVVLGDTVGNEHFYFSGNDEARLNDLQKMLDDPDIDAILMGRGGYGLSRIIDQIDWEGFVRHPKWICGFSDITVLHQHINRRLKTAVLHGPMCGAFTAASEHADHILSWRNALMGEPTYLSFPKQALNRFGKARGKLIGGNLAIMAHLSGSRSQVKTKNCILFLEDIGEYLYNIDRMLYNLKRAGKLEELAGVVIGGFSECQDTERPFGKNCEEIIYDIFSEYSYPLAFGLPCGHEEINYALKLGVPHQLFVTEYGSILKEQKLI